MVPSFDPFVSNLLCAEENCIFGTNDDDDDDVDEIVVKDCAVPPCFLRSSVIQSRRNRTLYGGGCGGDELPFMSDECLIGMVEKESHHLPVDGYLVKLQNGDLDVGARKDAVDWIGKV